MSESDPKRLFSNTI